MATKIVIDPGHGGYDNGASYENRKEKEDVLELALEVGRILEKDGFDVVYTRTTDVYDSPVRKAQIGNENNADFFVSIHRNSSPSVNQYNGVQTLIYNDGGVKKTMAENVNKELEKLGFRNINVDVRPDLAVLRRTKMPAILVEVGFINSDVDNKLFDEKFNQIAEAIANGIKMTIDNDSIAAAEASHEEIGWYDEYRNDSGCTYQILIGLFRSYGAATFQMNRLIFDGYDVDIYEVDGLFQVRVGKYEDIEEALIAQRSLRDRGYDSLIVCI